MAVTNHTVSSCVLAERWSTATGALLSSSTVCCSLLHRGLHARLPLHSIPLSLNHKHLQRAQQHSAWHIQWQQITFFDESHYTLYYNDGRIHYRRYRG